jgi:hypothetical protein
MFGPVTANHGTWYLAGGWNKDATTSFFQGVGRGIASRDGLLARFRMEWNDGGYQAERDAGR